MLPAGAAEQGTGVMPAHRRLEALKTAGELLAPRKAGWRTVVADMPDPFFRSNFATMAEEEAATEEPVRARLEHSAADVLAAIAPGISPTGTMLIGAEPYLLMDGRRFRVGDQISVTFEGLVHQVVLSSIERNSYTLRLKESELTREFK
jgi:hypothetical protein